MLLKAMGLGLAPENQQVVGLNWLILPARSLGVTAMNHTNGNRWPFPSSLWPEDRYFQSSSPWLGQTHLTFLALPGALGEGVQSSQGQGENQTELENSSHQVEPCLTGQVVVVGGG